jgi:GxxExxY protein
LIVRKNQEKRDSSYSAISALIVRRRPGKNFPLLSLAPEIPAENSALRADMWIALAGSMTESATAAALNRLTEQIIGAAIEVNRELGPGMLEAAYEACLAYELVGRGLTFERQRSLPLTYKGQILDLGYRIDLLVERAVVVEVKAVERLDRIHLAQMRSYLQQSGCKVGLLFNFNTKYLGQDGITRIVNNFPDGRTINAECVATAEAGFSEPEPRKT